LSHRLFMDDSYLRVFTARVERVVGSSVALSQTAFHPLSGGVANDLGELIASGVRYRVFEVVEDASSDAILHKVTPNAQFEEGIAIEGQIDWERRYSLMKLHTASHILSSIMFEKYGAMVTGGHIEPDIAKDDFSLDTADRKVFEDAVSAVNEIISRGAEVRTYYEDREQALKIPGIVKLANRLPPNAEKLRLVEIRGVDIQADGGPHVRNTEEIDGIVLIGIDNKGRHKKRVYYKLA